MKDFYKNCIQNARKIFGIKGWKKKWSDEERENFRKDLGEDYDENLARKYNCSVDYVLDERISLGISSFERKKATEERENFLHDVQQRKKAIEEMENFLHERKKAIEKRKKEKKRNMLKDLGKMSDSKVADKYDCSTTKIYMMRKKLGILPFQQPKHFDEYEMKNILKDLGKMPDREAAEKYGCSTGKIRNMRIQFGILPFRKRGKSNKE